MITCDTKSIVYFIEVRHYIKDKLEENVMKRKLLSNKTHFIHQTLQVVYLLKSLEMNTSPDQQLFKYVKRKQICVYSSPFVLA